MQRIRTVDLDKVLKVGPDNASSDLLSAAMIFPANENFQSEYLEKLMLTGSFYPSPKSVNSSFHEKIVEGINNGIVAGSSLMYFRFLLNTEIKTKAGNPLKSSRRSVSYLCKEYNLGRDRKSEINNNQGYPKVTDPSAEKIWKDYQRVSHLWAAYIHIALDGNPTLVLPNDHFLTSIDISVLLFLARQYERVLENLTLNEMKDGKSVPGKVKPFRARYWDWNSDDVFVMDIPEINHIREWATGAASGYKADT
jgi:hypothetical protein